MQAVGVIPARWGSTRFAGKVLAPINGKPMIEHVWQRARQSRLLKEVIIACDDQRVVKAAEKFGAKAILTAKDHACGTDRTAEAAANVTAEIIVNIQGDEPLIHHSVIDSLVTALSKDPDCLMATAIKLVRAKDELENPNVVKVVVDAQGNALYFSRSVIPYDRDKAGIGKIKYYKHLGIYAYRKSFLLEFRDLPKSRLEQAEQLEQLRALEAGVKIKTVLTDIETIGVDTPEDLARVARLLR
ncbi:MAG: 3-deoxy-manno-octulosonate cytidylyltransferase [Omnitrophica WOR_2 bacterium RIFCSPHIGHO2_01_FULL_52_10]|nr:MAG: 3-deoxy-manno-octulosonate cytidylyltransferase [Omnitrophica WOR_2 bacterium RIFCSPHIGHO2_01_FULL_52_10]